MAVGAGRFKSAETILAALEEFRPGSEQIDTARMISAINKGDFNEAISYADDVALPRHPESAMIKAFKAMALVRLGRIEEARAPIRDAAEQTYDLAASQLAKDMLA
jgi:Flp pilus assembly protein TadD